MSTRILTVAVRAEHDLVLVRQRTRQLAEQLGIDGNRRTRLATAVSEISRNAFQYAGSSEVEFLVERAPVAKMLVRIEDSGPGIAHLETIMDGEYNSDTGLGLGLAGARRLVDYFDIDTDESKGTSVVLGLDVPRRIIEDQELLERIEVLTRTSPGNPFGEVLQQNQELLRAQNALALVNQELEEAQKAKDRFLAMLAHELRNLLNALRSAMEVLRRDPGPEVGERMQQIADLQVDHLGRLIDDLLDASRIVRGTLHLDLRPIDLAAEVGSIVAAWKEQITENEIDLQIEVPAAPVWVSADPTRMAQIIGNLVSNASKFTDSGGSIRVRVENDGQLAWIHVTDDGCGLEEDVLERIFEPFAQTAEARKRMTGGLGLGLAIVKGLTEAHGGAIEASSGGTGEGLAVHLRLPLVEAPISAYPEDSAPAKMKESRRLRLLLVDDHEPTISGLSELLRLDGHQVHVASDGATALRKAESCKPELVLCDLGLPEMDGIEVARRLREQNPSARLIAVTGFVDDATRDEALEAGFESVLPKPLDFDRLNELIDEMDRGE